MTRFTHNEDNTVTDTKTGLTWSRDTIAKDVTHEEAEKKVAELDGEWRLPTVEELRELVDYTRRLPAIDTDAFPDTEDDWYWTSTSVAGHEASARWVVYFYFGIVLVNHRNGYACVRAVRAGQ